VSLIENFPPNLMLGFMFLVALNVVFLPIVMFWKKERLARSEAVFAEFKRQIEESAQKKEQFATIIRNLPTFGAWLYGPQGEPIIMSESFLGLVGMTMAEAADFGWAMRIPVGEREEKVRKWRHCFANGLRWEDEIQIDGVDGKRYTLLCQGRPIVGDDGKITAWTGVKLDITERVRVEEALRSSETQLKQEKEHAESADRAKSRFLANMSHEIRTPLSAIIGYSELLLDRKKTEESRDEYLRTVIRNGQQLTRIINDILDLSKIESGVLTLESQVFSLEEMLADVRAMLGLQAQVKGLRLVVLSETPLPMRVRSDQIRIKQILINLIGNAIKFTNHGDVTVRVSATSRGSPAEMLVCLNFDIEDTGIGLDEKSRFQLFRAFEQADSSVARALGGTGLGLYLARKLARALCGNVTLVRTEKGHGSLFRATVEAKREGDEFFTLPRAVESRNSVAGISPSTDGESNLDGVRILVVDDSLDMQILVEHILESYGAKVECADDGLAGVERALQGSFDVVLMDIEMPKANGYEAVRSLRQHAYSKPVIALTAHAMRGERERCLGEGFDDYLVKPIQRQPMLQAIMHFTGPKTTEAQGLNEAPIAMS
jgi:PAS domain S-box-containing protein